jgi:toxin ParE1/3/4
MRIRWSRPAAGDLTQICDYIERHGSASTARRVALSIYQHVGTLAEFPERGRTGRSRRPDTRELVVAGLPYLAVYRIGRDGVEILRILHGAQEWP